MLCEASVAFYQLGVLLLGAGRRAAARSRAVVVGARALQAGAAGAALLHM